MISRTWISTGKSKIEPTTIQINTTMLPGSIKYTLLSLPLIAGIFFSVLLPFGTAGQSYLKLHEKAIVVDTHNDVLSTATLHGMDIGTHRSGKPHSVLPRFPRCGTDAHRFH